MIGRTGDGKIVIKDEFKDKCGTKVSLPGGARGGFIKVKKIKS